MEEEEQEDLNSIEFYLRTLRKKVEHQLKNPFQINFASYSFTELMNWKNNVLQLDATSRLYGQRVDYLHSGTLNILGSVVNIEQLAAKQKQQEVPKVQQRASDEQNIFLKHLQNPEKLNGETAVCTTNLLQWREIMRKRDTLPLLMLNQLSLSNILMLKLIDARQDTTIYSQIFHEELVYLKLINFSLLSQQSFTLFRQMQETIKQIDEYLMGVGISQKERRADFNIDSFNEFDFPLSLFNPNEPSNSKQGHHYVGETSFQAGEIDNFEEEQETQTLEGNSEADSEVSQAYSLFSLETKTSKSSKSNVRRRDRKKKEIKNRTEDYVNFMGLNPTKEDIFEIDQPLIEEPFLNHKDHLHLRHIRYTLPFNVKAKTKVKRSLVRPKLNLTQQSMQLDCSFEIDPYQLNSTLQLSNFSPGLSKRSLIKFKEAALPIKQLKKRIRQSVSLQHNLSLSEVRNVLKQEDPLDIFISVLHIAAEEGKLVTL